jgi:hypothetical protein
LGAYIVALLRHGSRVGLACASLSVARLALASLALVILIFECDRACGRSRDFSGRGFANCDVVSAHDCHPFVEVKSNAQLASKLRDSCRSAGRRVRFSGPDLEDGSAAGLRLLDLAFFATD